jgi:hypothetical protein
MKAVKEILLSAAVFALLVGFAWESEKNPATLWRAVAAVLAFAVAAVLAVWKPWKGGR